MKHFYYFVLLSLGLMSLGATAQVTILSENCGSPAGTVTIAANSWQNGSPIAYSGSADVRNTTTSSGYTGASGNGNVFFAGVGNSLIISGINTSGYTSLVLRFGLHKSTIASNASELVDSVSTDGVNYTAITIPAQATGSGTATWRQVTITGGTIPATSNLRIKFRNTSASVSFRIDDIVLTGNPTFYSKATGSLDSLGAWGTNTDGTGTAPSNFTNPAQVFNIRNGNPGNITGSTWTVSGTNSKVVVDGTDLTIPASKAIAATIDVNALRTLTIQSTTLPTLGTLDDSSTVTYSNGTSNLLSYTTTYGNIVLNGTGTSVTNTAGTVAFAGNFTLQNSATMSASSVDLRTIGTLDQLIAGNGNTFSIGSLLKTRTKPGKVSLRTNTPMTINGSITMHNTSAAALFSDSLNSINVFGNVTMGGDTVGYNLTGSIILNGSASTIKINGDTASQATYARANFNNIEVATTGTSSVSFVGTGTNIYHIRGNFTITSSGSGNIVFANTNLLHLRGNFTYTPTSNVITYGTSVIVFSGLSRQNYSSNIATSGNTIPRLTMNNLSSIGLVLNSPLSVSNTMTFTNGKIRTQGNTFFWTSTGAISAATNSSYVVGPVSEAVASGGTITKIYPIGDTTFSPVRVSSSGGTPSASGAITVVSNYGNHPNLGTSYINNSQYLNRYYTITNSGVVGHVSGSTLISVTFTYTNTSDIVGGTSNSGFSVRHYTDTGWVNRGSVSNTTSLAVGGLLPHASTNSSIPFTLAFKSYAMGNPSCAGTPSAGTISATPSSLITPDTSFLTVTGASTDTSYTYQWHSSPDGVTYTPISGATATSYTTDTIFATTFFRYIVSCPANNLSGTATKIVSVTQAKPEITSVSPNVATPGTSVTITGSNFDTVASNNLVYFGATAVTPSAGSTTSLTVAVPKGALATAITVTDTTNGQTGYSGGTIGSPIAPFLPIFDSTGFFTDTTNFRNAINYTSCSSCGGTPSPYTGAIGDVDGDGRPDLVVNNRGSNIITILRNKMTGAGPGSFITADSFELQTTSYTTLGNPNNIKLADMDGDGKLDMIIAHHGSTSLSIYRNLTTTIGSPNFGILSNRVDIALSTLTAVVAIADFDGDGKADIAATGGNVFNPSASSSTVKIIRNLIPAPGAFSSSSFSLVDSIPSTSTITTGLSVADYDQDGKPDVAFSSIGAFATDNVINVSRNTSTIGTISFSSTITLNGSGSGASDVVSGDFDNDGKPDIVATNYSSNTVSAFHNTTTGSALSFSLPSTIASALNPLGLGVGDVNGDRKLDLFVSNTTSNTISVYRNIGVDSTITFSAKRDFATGTGPTTVTIGDVNADNFADIVVGNSGSGNVSVLQNYPLPRIFNIVGVDSVCITANTTFSNAVSGGAWTSSAPTIASVNGVTGEVTGIAAGVATITYTVTVGGNTNTRTKSITVVGFPLSGTISGPTSICPADSINLSNTGSAGGPGAWSSSNVAVATVNATTGGVYGIIVGSTDIYYTVTSSFGCGVAIDTYTVNVTLPVAGSITGTTTFCAGSISPLSATGDAGGVWTSDATSIASVNASTGVVTGVSGGTANITYTVTTACGTSEATTLVTIQPLPAVGAITGSSTVCNGASTLLSDTTAGGTWSSSAPTIASVSASGLVFGLSIGSATISYAVTNACGTTTVTFNVAVTTVPAAPAAIAGVTTLCIGNTTTLTNDTLGGTWSSSNTSLASVNAGGIVTGVAAGTPTITYSVSNSCGSSISTTTVTVLSPATASITSFTIPCSGYSAFIEFTGTSGATLAYKVDGGAEIDSVLTGGTFTLNTGAITSAHTYTLFSVDNGFCVNVIDSTINIAPLAMQWVGGTSGHENKWDTASNWNCGVIPAITDDVTIPLTLHAPTIRASYGASVNGITIDSGVVITIGTNAVLNVEGAVVNNGKTAGTGVMSLNGAATQSISGIGSVKNMELDNPNGATISAVSRLTIDSVLTVTNGELNTNDSLVLGATTSLTSRLAPIGSGGSIVGNARVMQGIQGGLRRYRFWSHPFSNTIPYSQMHNYIDLTGTGGAANGFRTTATNMPSVFRYNTIGGNSGRSYDPGWRPVTSALPTANDSNKIKRYQGVRVFMRGQKDSGLGYTPYTPAAVVIGQWGNLNQGRLVVSLVRGATDSQDYNLLGNPYASPVDIGTVLHNAKVSGNIYGAFYVWNPALGAGGAFQAVPISTVSATPYYLQANTAFEVRAVHNNDTLVFNESNKGSVPSTILLRTAPEYTVLNILDENNHTWDMLHIKFDENASDEQDMIHDGAKLGGGELNFYSISADGKRQSIDVRPYNKNKSIPLGINSNYAQKFVIKAESVVLPADAELYLHDKLTQQYTPIIAGMEYPFTISKDKTTQGDDRFELVMKPADKKVVIAHFEATLAPNPANEEVNITYQNAAAANVVVRLTDINGVSLYQKDLGKQVSGVATLPLRKVAPGIYLVEIQAGNHKETKRLVKE